MTDHPPEEYVQMAKRWLNKNKIPTSGVCLSLAQLLWEVSQDAAYAQSMTEFAAKK